MEFFYSIFCSALISLVCALVLNAANEQIIPKKRKYFCVLNILFITNKLTLMKTKIIF